MESIRWQGVLNTSITKNDNKKRRSLALISYIIVVVCIVFEQWSFITLDPSATMNAYAFFLLVPIALASLSLGTITGTALGVFAGVTLFVHARIMPLDYQELAIVSPSASMALFGAFGLVIALLFWKTLPKAQSRKQRFAIIYADCFVASLLVSAVNTLLVPAAFTPLEDVIQVFADTLITGSACLILEAAIRYVQSLADDIGLREAFSLSIFLFVFLAFIATMTISFVTTTVGEKQDAEAAIKSEANYLCLQLESLGNRSAAFERIVDDMGASPQSLEIANPEDYQLLSNPLGDVLNGYTMEQTGTVLVVSNDRVLMSDDERIPEGTSMSELGEDTQSAIATSLDTAEVQYIVYDGVLNSDGDTGGYRHDMQIGYLLAAQQGDYTVVIIEPSSMVFRNRQIIMGREVAITLVVLVVVFMLVTRLLSITVASRIDQTNDSLERITSGELDVRVEVAGTREFKSLSAGINTTVDALNDLIAESERRMEQDLKTARAIQEGALPKRIPAFPNANTVDLFASMDAAKEVGGDFYDYFEIDDHTVAFLIADVSGKGIPGALFMMVAKAAIQNYLSTGMDIAEAISAANAYLCLHNEAGMFVTVWAATLDWRTGELTYVNAGHNYPLLRHGRNGSWEWLDTKCGLFLGVFEMAKYKKAALALKPGDELVLYTDGVNEAFSVDEEEYGNDRLEAFLKAHPDERPNDLTRDLRADVAAWAEGAEQSDDITIVVLEYGHDNDSAS